MSVHTMMRWALICLVASCTLFTSSAQSKSQKVRTLEKQRNEALRKMDATVGELNKLKKTTASEAQKLALVRRQVAQRKQAIELIGQELEALQQVIDSLGGEIVRLRSRERHLLEQYSRSIRALRRADGNADRLLFLLSSKSFNEMLLRQKFLQNYAVATSAATKEIKEARTKIEEAQREVNQSHEQKAELLSLRNNERKKLEAEAGQKTAELGTLKKRERELAQNLHYQRQQAMQLEKQIQAQISAEIAIAEEKARRTREARKRSKKQRSEQTETSAKSNTSTDVSEKNQDSTEEHEERRSSTNGGYAMNAEERKLSGSFAQNKGRLPLPVRGRYDVVRRFGIQQHNAHSKIQVKNGGIDLRVYGDKTAYAVFDGVVTSVFMTPGYGQSIIVRHGNYLTVYSNLSNVRVRTKQRIATREAIGTISSSGEADRANVLHFQLWHERNNLNPEQWIRRS